MRFRDLQKQYEVLRAGIDRSVESVFFAAHFISGPQITELEEKLANYVGVKHCITCANGTDALTIALMSWGIGLGDAVFVPDFTFFSSGECPASVGATPIFVDVDERTYNIDPIKLEEAIIRVQNEKKYRPRAVVTVDLFGLPANYDAIRPICEKYGLLILEDGAQGFGGSIRRKRACSFGDIATTSFFPAKPLGCYGDGGAIFTDNDEWAALIHSICVHGKSGEDKYDNIRLGMNSRLDTLQAAILLPKFEAFKKYELGAVNQVAAWYNEKMAGMGLILPEMADGFVSSWAQYTVQLPENVDRAKLMDELKKEDIPTMIYYRKPMHKQGAFAGTDSAVADCPVTEQLCDTVLSLPMHPYLTEKMVELVTSNVGMILNQNSWL